MITPEHRSVNDPEFIVRLRRDLRPDFALSLICLQIFKNELLETFETAVNYHNGLLPAYRGLGATQWSVYNGEPRTGFSFHRMTPGIDEGPVLYDDAVTVRPRVSALMLEWEKTVLATRAIPTVLDAMIRDEPSAPQAGTPGYYGQSASDRITAIIDPSLVTWDDLVRRLHAFSAVDITLAGRPYRVTKAKRVEDSNSSPLTFRTADGTKAQPTRFSFLPYPLYRLYRRMTRR